MQSSVEEITPILGTSMGGGFYAGRLIIAGQPYAIVVAPKEAGQRAPSQWIKSRKDVPSALSYSDGLANSRAMAEAGSELAQWAIDLRIDGHDDWYLPSVDELEICYRNLKPGSALNWCYARSGINLHAIPPTLPYTPDAPAQTLAELFRQGGSEAFDLDVYWSSTRHASDPDCAWSQGFSLGIQHCSYPDFKFRARAVRRLPI